MSHDESLEKTYHERRAERIGVDVPMNQDQQPIATPRTDEQMNLVLHSSPFIPSGFVDADFARTLERELVQKEQELANHKESSKRDGNWMDKWGACKVCDGEIPYGHTDNCDIFKNEMQIQSLQSERDKLQQAIRLHRDQRGDDRCWLDDQKLYEVLGEGTGDNSLPPKEKFLANCSRFYDNRCHNAEWKSYQELEEERDKLRKALEGIATMPNYDQDDASRLRVVGSFENL